jgi:PhnB protein
MRVTPNYHFHGQCEEALRLYARALNGTVTVLLRNTDANPKDASIEGLSDEQRSHVFHAEMVIGGQRLMFSDSLEAVPQGQNISTVITFDTPEAVKHAHDILVDGGTIIHPLQATTYSSSFVSLIDRFGMRWELMTETGSS